MDAGSVISPMFRRIDWEDPVKSKQYIILK
jgi:hypothetical protein